jgi:hypothetical protein
LSKTLTDTLTGSVSQPPIPARLIYAIEVVLLKVGKWKTTMGMCDDLVEHGEGKAIVGEVHADTTKSIFREVGEFEVKHEKGRRTSRRQAAKMGLKIIYQQKLTDQPR